MAAGTTARIDIIIHATEDASRILQSLQRSLGVEPDRFEMSHTRGHYRNPIVTAAATLRKGDSASFAKRLFARLGRSQIDQILQTLPSRVEDSALYLRLDRQEMIRSDSILLRDSGTIRIRIGARIHGEPAAGVFGRLLLDIK